MPKKPSESTIEFMQRMEADGEEYVNKHMDYFVKNTWLPVAGLTIVCFVSMFLGKEIAGIGLILFIVGVTFFVGRQIRHEHKE